MDKIHRHDWIYLPKLGYEGIREYYQCKCGKTIVVEYENNQIKSYTFFKTMYDNGEPVKVTQKELFLVKLLAKGCDVTVKH